MIIALFAALAAHAAAAAPSGAPAANLAAPAAEAPPPGAGDHPRGPRQQVFIAPSGAPFRADPRGPAPKAAWFASADTNHDGRLDAREFTADVVAFASGLDANHDGVIDAGELTAYEASMPEMHPHAPGEGGTEGAGGWRRHGGPDGGPDGASGPPPGGGAHRTPPPPGLARYGLLPDAEPVAAMDANHDGRITHDEVLAAAAARFAALDTGHRGFLTLKDLPETWNEARRREMRARMEQGGSGHGDGAAGDGGRGWGGGQGGGMGDGPGGGMGGGGFGDGGGDPGAGGQ